MYRLLGFATLLQVPVALLAGNPVSDDRVTPARLVKDFMTNEAYAEETYVHKPVELTGQVVRVSRTKYESKNGEKAWILELDQERAGKGEKCELDLLLFFDEKERGELAKLKPGQTVVVKGICSKRIIWSAAPKAAEKDYSQVHIESCTLVKPK